MNDNNRPSNKMVIDDNLVGRGKPKKKGARKTLIWILAVLVLALVGGIIYVWTDVSKVWGDLGFDASLVVEDDGPEAEAEGLPTVTFSQGTVPSVNKAEGVVDIVLIGVDNRDASKFTGRSDVLMIVRLNTNTNELKLVSFMRDTLVAIDGHGQNRINTAYHYGSIDLANDMFIDNYGISPDYYMVVNFYGMEDVVNAMDGVDVEIESKERTHVNNMIDELNRIDGGSASHVSSTGMTHLNGRQAVAYMRVRKVGTDTARISRQQEVLNALFMKATSVSASQIPGLIDTLSDYVRTDIPLGKMAEFAEALRGMQGQSLETLRYPSEFVNGNYDGKAIIQPKDVDAEMQQLHDFLN